MKDLIEAMEVVKMKTHNTIVVGQKDGKIIFIKTYDYDKQKDEAQADLKEVIDAGLEWNIGEINTFKISTVIE